jgi:excisionase family DNA binding protein
MEQTTNSLGRLEPFPPLTGCPGGFPVAAVDPVDSAATAVEGPAPRLLWTTEEAAKRLAVSARLLERLTAERRIAATRVGRAVRYSEDSLRRFIADNTGEPIEDAAGLPVFPLMFPGSTSVDVVRTRRMRSRRSRMT